MIEFIDKDLLLYKDALLLMDSLRDKAYKQGRDFILFCRHYPVFTVGSDDSRFDGIKVVKTDRGGSITYHDEGQLMVYFVVHVPYPAKFYKRVINILNDFFQEYDKRVFYDKKRPGFYIENRKIASLGFRYQKGISKHGVAINISTDLKTFNTINPCNLNGIKATSMKNEGYEISFDKAKERIKDLVTHRRLELLLPA